jgi:hypothetical protein
MMDFPTAADGPRYAAARARLQAEADCQALCERFAFGDDADSAVALAELRETEWCYIRMNEALQPLFELLDCCAAGCVLLADLSSLKERARRRLPGVFVPSDDGKALRMDADIAREWQRRRDLMSLLLYTRETPASSVEGPQLPCDSDATSEKPKCLLTTWAEIVNTLGMKPHDRGKIKSLNERYSGPIPTPRKGKQPIVERAALIEWWNRLAITHQTQQNRRDGRQASIEGHDYGRDGTVLPEIHGSVRKRRGKSKT